MNIRKTRIGLKWWCMKLISVTVQTTSIFLVLKARYYIPVKEINQVYNIKTFDKKIELSSPFSMNNLWTNHFNAKTFIRRKPGMLSAQS